MVDISVIVPVYNEEQRFFQKNLCLINDYLLDKFKDFEIIVVNDGSTDSTKETLKKITKEIHSLKAISYTPNKGKGFALKMGVLAARGSKVILLDADMSVPLHFISKATVLLKDYDVVVGSRLAPGAKIAVSQPLMRRAFSFIFNKLAHYIFDLKVADFMCGFKAFNKEAAKTSFQHLKLNRFCFDLEVILIAEQLKYKIYELPVEWKHVSNSRIKIIKDSFISLYEFYLLRKKYR